MPTALALKMEERNRFQATPKLSCQRKSSRPPKTNRGSGFAGSGSAVVNVPLEAFAEREPNATGSSKVTRAAEVLAKSMGAGVGDVMVVTVESLAGSGACTSAAAAPPSASKVHAISLFI